MDDALAAFGLVFLAELGDKSMLLAMAFAARYRALVVLAGIALAALVATGVATLVGAALGAALPQRTLAVAAGALFLVFGVLALRGDDEPEEIREPRDRSVLLGVTIAFIAAEIGDKTTLATAALASTQAALPTWLGASVGMTAASGIAIAVASVLGSRLPPRAVRLAAAGAFVGFGVLLLFQGISGRAGP